MRGKQQKDERLFEPPCRGLRTKAAMGSGGQKGLADAIIEH